MMERSGDPLYDVIKSVYHRHRLSPSVSPSWIASQGMAEIDFPRSLHGLGYIGCHLQMRQIARSFCRRFDPTDASKDMDDLFSETLQERYPVFHAADEEPEYVRREYLTDAQIHMNVERLRRSGRARLKHADALQAWGRQRAAA